MKTIRYLVGLLLILIGGFSLITYIFHLNNELIHHLWFLCVLIPGLYFEMNYFQTRKNPGQLVPGGILTVIGLLFCLVAFLLIILIIVRTLVFGDPTSGWPSMVCIIFFVSGVQLFSLGIIGQYMSKSYLEIKHRPIYIIRETEKDEE